MAPSLTEESVEKSIISPSNSLSLSFLFYHYLFNILCASLLSLKLSPFQFFQPIFPSLSLSSPNSEILKCCCITGSIVPSVGQTL